MIGPFSTLRVLVLYSQHASDFLALTYKSLFVYLDTERDAVKSQKGNPRPEGKPMTGFLSFYSLIDTFAFKDSWRVLPTKH